MSGTEEDRCIAEVEDLHAFFERWFLGAAPEAEFARMASVLAAEFRMITPGGVEKTREEVLRMVRERHGARAGGTCRIRIRNPVSRVLGEDLTLVLYEEWQEMDGPARGRLSSALFRHDPDTPHGVEWIHLHETWLPEAGA